MGFVQAELARDQKIIHLHHFLCIIVYILYNDDHTWWLQIHRMIHFQIIFTISCLIFQDTSYVIHVQVYIDKVSQLIDIEGILELLPVLRGGRQFFVPTGYSELYHLDMPSSCCSHSVRCHIYNLNNAGHFLQKNSPTVKNQYCCHANKIA